MNDETSTGTVLVTLGRIEERLNNMSEHKNTTDARLEKVEERLSRIELNLAANVRPKTPWWVWVAGIGAIVLLGLNGLALVNVLVDIATVMP